MILKWNLLTGETTSVCKLGPEVFPINMELLPNQSKGGRNQSNLIAVTCSDGKVQFLSQSGRVEKSVLAHKGAVLSGKWSHDGNAFVTSGEDGQIKIWSRSGMLRSTLAQLSSCIYSVCWSPESELILYSCNKQLSIKPLQPSGKSVTWKAHDGIVLCADWSVANNLIVSGGEDCKYKVWDSYGRPMYSSSSHDYPVTSVGWSPDGYLFAIGLFNTLRLCDKSGWSHSLDKPSVGSILNVSWSDDGTQLAAACAGGDVLLAHCIEKRLEWAEFEAALISRKTIEVKSVSNNVRELLEMKDRVMNIALGFHFFVVMTSSQCHVYSTSNFNTPAIFDLRDGTVTFVQQAEKNFIFADGGGLHIYSYEGRHVCNLKIPGAARSTMYNSKTLSLNGDVVAVRDTKDDKNILLFDATTGKQLGNGTCVKHKLEVLEICLSQKSMVSDQCLAFIDKHHDLYLTPLKKSGLEYRISKLASMIHNACWNSSVGLLCGLQDSKLFVWFYPTALFLDKEILPHTTYEKGISELGKNPELCSYDDSTITIRRPDGSVCSVAVSPYAIALHQLVGSDRWNEAVRLCHFAKDNILWACLAAMSMKKKDLNSAEIAYSAIGEAEKVEYLNYIKNLKETRMQAAEMSLFCGDLVETETQMLHSGMIYRAIQLNLDLFRWEKALDLAIKHKTHLDTVLGFRKNYLERMHKNENIEKFKQYSKGVVIDWQNIEAKMQAEMEKGGQ